MHSAEFRRCLEEIDIAGVRRLWAHVSPHLPQPKTDHEALVTIHHARTQANSIRLRLRAWSHRWLLDNGYPSGLPDELKPSAERLYPKIVQGVGISVNAKSALMKPITGLIRKSMEDAVSDAFADGNIDPVFVSARMKEAREKEVKRLLGRIAG